MREADLANDKVIALTATSERPAGSFNGYMMLVLLLLVVAFQLSGVFNLASDRVGWLPIFSVTVGPLLLLLILPGFYMLQPNQAAAITLFGSYMGTDRTTGLRWTWPWMAKKKLSVRANNFISDKIKVNDLRGNPIEMAAQIVWRVVDTAQALFDVDDYRAFVSVQVEAAIRTIGSRYPYDDFEHQEVTLRGNHDQVGNELRAELQARLAVAGITVDECGFTHLAPADRVGIDVAFADRRRIERDEQLRGRVVIVEIIPFVGPPLRVREAGYGRIAGGLDAHLAGRRPLRMANEMPADHPAVPRPVIVRIRRRMDRDDPAAAAQELLQRRAPVADQPFRCRFLGIGRAAEQNDGAETLEARGGKNRRVLTRHDRQPTPSGDRRDRPNPVGDRIMPEPGRARIDQDRAAAGLRGRRRRGDAESDDEKDQAEHRPEPRIEKGGPEAPDRPSRNE
jgi:hypothetical protein